jgi:hypothetical protein
MRAFMKKRIDKKYYIGFLLVLLFLYLVLLSQSKGDFKVFLEAAGLLREGKNIYHVYLSDGIGYYFYSPLFAMLLIPFTYVPSFIPNLLWLMASAFWVYRIWKLIQKDFDLSAFSKKQINLLIILSVVCTIRFLLYNFGLIQMTVFMLWAILESIHLFENKKEIKGSILLALAINIKLLPIVILPYLLYRKKFYPFFLTLFYMLVFLFLPVLFIGKTMNTFLLHEWWSSINPSQEALQFEADWGVHSLTALVPSLLMVTVGELDLKRNIFNLSPAIVSQVTLAVRLVFIVFTIYFLGIKNSKAISTIQRNWEIAYLTLVIPLIFPHQQKYAFYMLLPAIAYLLYFLIVVYNNQYKVIGKTKWNVVLGLLIASFVLMTLSTDGVIGRYYNNITQHYKTITYGAILVAIALAMSKPKYLAIDDKEEAI